MSGRSQHVTIPREFRFRSNEVTIRRDPTTGDIILSEIPDIDEVFAALDAANFPADYFVDPDRHRHPPQVRPSVEHLFDDPPEGKDEE